MQPDYTPESLPFSLFLVKARIAGRRIRMAWTALPSWMRDGLMACAIAFPLWLLLVAVLLVF